MRIIIFGDSYGLPQLQRHLPSKFIIAVVGASIRLQYYDFIKQLSESLSLPYFMQPRSYEDAYLNFVGSIRDLSPDLIIVNSYSMKLRADILAIPHKGAVNIHGGLLPQYRGCNPIQWAILNNETETGVTMHFMDEDFDTGDIIAQRRIPLFFEDTWLQVQKRLATATEDLLAEVIPELLTGDQGRYPQDQDQANYCKRRYPEDGEINWQDSVLHIYNLIRSLVKPHPGAFYYSKGVKIILDQYHSMTQVISLKYKVIGLQQLESKSIAFNILTMEDLDFIIRSTCYQYPDNITKLFDKPINNYFDKAKQCNDRVLFGIMKKGKDDIIGIAQLSNINNLSRRCNIDINLNRDHYSNDLYKYEIIRILLYFAFKELELEIIQAHLLSIDQSLVNVYVGMGFRQIDSISGHNSDYVVLELLRERYDR